MPMKIEVDALMQLLSDHGEGSVIEYAAIESAIGVSKDSNRGRGIIASWKRRAMRERSILLVAIPGNGYEVADSNGKLTFGASEVKSANRKIVRAGVVAETADPTKLDDEGRRLRDHLRTLPVRLRLAELLAPKRVSME